MRAGNRGGAVARHVGIIGTGIPATARAAAAGPLRLPAPGRADSMLLHHLKSRDIVTPEALAAARTAHLRFGHGVEDVLLAAGAIDETGLQAALAAAFGLQPLPGRLTVDPALVAEIGLPLCLAARVAPIRRQGAAVVVATASPTATLRHRQRLEAAIGRFRIVLAPRAAVEEAVLGCQRDRLLTAAERSAPQEESCRGWSERRMKSLGLGLLALALLALGLAPVAVLVALTALAALSLVAMTLLRVAAALAALWGVGRGAHRFRHRPVQPPRSISPTVSVMVALYREPEILGRLMRRLSALSYPHDRLEIVLVMEEDDHATRSAFETMERPAWMRAVTVPPGAVKTKPRALNYALPLCRGDIVGIYDAEDAPDRDQIERVVAHFATAPRDVVCVQGMLDFYNSRESWITRVFTLEYATWFRLILPGLARLRLVVPLGGTTLFFRRHALEELGRWDAFNVTEDADLGLRLARHGFRTEVIFSTTREEATSRPSPWIRQRSRWLKGYAMTAIGHMRHPLRLHRDLGTLRSAAVAVLFLGTLLQYLLAPLLWSFWLTLFGLPHPVIDAVRPAAAHLLFTTFALCETANLVTAALAVATTRHRPLLWWLPVMHMYFPLGTLAAWKGVVELFLRPYYWDKTSHGRARNDADLSEAGDRPAAPRRWRLRRRRQKSAICPASDRRRAS